MEFGSVALVISVGLLCWLTIWLGREIKENSKLGEDSDGAEIANTDFYLERMGEEGAGEYADNSGLLTFAIPEELGADLALVFGSSRDLERFSGEVAEVVRKIPSELTRTAVGTNALVDAGIQLAEQQGMLVRLTKDSAAAYKSLQKIKDGSGAVLGVMRDSNGKFARVLKFNPAGNVSAVASLTGLMSAVAMQAQLAAIEKAIAEVAATTKRIEAVQWNWIDSEIRAAYQMLDETYRAAENCGLLTDLMWQQIQGLGLLVLKYEYFTSMQLNDISQEVKGLTNTKKKRDWFRANNQRLHQNLAAAEISTRVSAQYAALRIWRLAVTGDPSLPFYTKTLHSGMRLRTNSLQEIHAAMVGAIDAAGADTRHRFGIIPLWNSKSLERLLTSIRQDFEKVTGRDWNSMSSPDTRAVEP